MAEEGKTEQTATETTKQVNDKAQSEKVETKDDKDLIKSLDKEGLDTIKQFYTSELEKAKKEIAGLNRAKSDTDKKLKEYERRELTESEKKALEDKEIKEEWNKIWRLKAVNKFELVDEEYDFSDYLTGDSEEEIINKAGSLKKLLDERIQKGIAKGVEERISQGYIPKSSTVQQGEKTIEQMTKEELTELSRKAVKENNYELLTKITQEGSKRMKNSMK